VPGSKRAGGKSQARFARYESATTIGMFFDLHPGDRAQANKGLCHDVEKGLIRISSSALLSALTGIAVNSLISPVNAFIAGPAVEWCSDIPVRVTTGWSLLDATGPGSPAPATPGILNHLDALPDLVTVSSFLDRMGQAAERGCQAALAEEERIAAAVPAMAAIRRLKALEGGAHLPALAGDPSVLDAFVEETVHLLENLFSFSAAPGEESIKSIPEARRSKDWLGTGGWKQHTEEELFRCIVTHKALERRTADDYAAALRQHGKHKADLQKLVLVFKQKWLAKNVPDRKKVRLTVGDLKVRDKVENTYAPTVAFDSTRLLIQLGVLRGARRTTKDVGGASSLARPPRRLSPAGASSSSRSPRASQSSATPRRTSAAARTTSRSFGTCSDARALAASGASATTSFYGRSSRTRSVSASSSPSSTAASITWSVGTSTLSRGST